MHNLSHSAPLYSHGNDRQLSFEKGAVILRGASFSGNEMANQSFNKKLEYLPLKDTFKCYSPYSLESTVSCTSSSSSTPNLNSEMVPYKLSRPPVGMNCFNYIQKGGSLFNETLYELNANRDGLRNHGLRGGERLALAPLKRKSNSFPTLSTTTATASGLVEEIPYDGCQYGGLTRTSSLLNRSKSCLEEAIPLAILDRRRKSIVTQKQCTSGHPLYENSPNVESFEFGHLYESNFLRAYSSEPNSHHQIDSSSSSRDSILQKPKRKKNAHSPYCPRPYSCKYESCDKTYKNLNGLKYHYSHHHTEEENTQSHEAELYNTRSLNQSLYPFGKNDDFKPHKCPYESCIKRYKNANGLKYHVEHSHQPQM